MSREALIDVPKLLADPMARTARQAELYDPHIAPGTRIRAAGKTDTDAGICTLTRVLDLLPKLRAAVLIGRKAERASELLAQLRPAVRVFKSPHPSPLFVNNAPGNRQRILDVF